MVTQRAVLLAVGVVVACSRAAGAPDSGRGEDLERIRGEIGRLRVELEALERQERSVLGEVERLGAAVRLREAELAQASLRIDAVSDEIASRDRRIAEIERAQERRRGYLAFRLRDLYKRGPVGSLRRLMGGEDLGAYLDALRYAAWLAERDARVLREYRAGAAEVAGQRAGLERERERLAGVRAEAAAARAAAAGSREERARILEGIRVDQEKRQAALEELERASEALGALVGRLGAGSPPRIDVRKFQGLLDRPAAGEISAGFGKRVHPRFGTVVPHPGLDIDAPAGTEFRSVFDGSVLFASWLHGYGLTVIVDHGDGVVSVYAHAAALVVQEGERVARGQVLGQVGETASLRGPYLYFEIRDRGKPVDPGLWIRRR